MYRRWACSNCIYATLRFATRGVDVLSPTNGNPTASPACWDCPYANALSGDRRLTAEVQAVHQGYASSHYCVTNRWKLIWYHQSDAGQVRPIHPSSALPAIPGGNPNPGQYLSDAGSPRLRLDVTMLAPIRYPASMFAADSLGSGVHLIHSDNVLGIHYYLLESDSAQSNLKPRAH